MILQATADYNVLKKCYLDSATGKGILGYKCVSVQNKNIKLHANGALHQKVLHLKIVFKLSSN